MVKLKVNNRNYDIEVDGDKPLLWVLREDIGLAGTKYGCGKGLCGACTVHIDSVASRSCITPVASVLGRSVTTIEGLSENGDHPLQRAWVKGNVMQCGYCQSGQLMSAAALLEKNPDPSTAQIHSAMKGNICRCGTYSRIEEAIKKVVADGVQQ